MESFMNLPIGKLRRLVKTARAKSQAVEREITKRLQRLRAAELREEFSRQFFTLKGRKCMGGHRARAAAKNCSPEPTHRSQALGAKDAESFSSCVPGSGMKGPGNGEEKVSMPGWMRCMTFLATMNFKVSCGVPTTPDFRSLTADRRPTVNGLYCLWKPAGVHVSPVLQCYKYFYDLRT
ncbi:hypothetical protein C0Q70_20014 [Pomacea canaliculata]|uniref:Uncharacterized protein n=1 Tax=Pomacea canaliculata TaxID=400727 RepID=A0A2T7NEF9_POMCA|nr:hypothetical protein C0Q70_20014 [Pomacea canaliculata]